MAGCVLGSTLWLIRQPGPKTITSRWKIRGLSRSGGASVTRHTAYTSTPGGSSKGDQTLEFTVHGEEVHIYPSGRCLSTFSHWSDKSLVDVRHLHSFPRKDSTVWSVVCILYRHRWPGFALLCSGLTGACDGGRSSMIVDSVGSACSDLILLQKLAVLTCSPCHCTFVSSGEERRRCSLILELYQRSFFSLSTRLWISKQRTCSHLSIRVEQKHNLSLVTSP